jgi:hypothetical protein
MAALHPANAKFAGCFSFCTRNFLMATLCSSNGFAKPDHSLGVTPGARQQCPDELDIAHPAIPSA